MNPSPAQIDQMINGASGMAIVYPPGTPFNRPEPASILVPLNTVDAAASAWKSLPLPAKLGVDLLYVTKDDADHPVLSVDGAHNTLFEVLTMEYDPASPNFGKGGQEVDCGVLFKFGMEASAEGRLTEGPLEALELFLTAKLATIKATLTSEGAEAAQQVYAEQMTAIEFKKFFKRYRVEQDAKYPGMGWKGVECPVTIDGDVCEACGRSDTALLQCGACGKVAYCGTACQREDWKASHRAFFPRGVMSSG